MNISPELWHQIDPLLSEALDMDESARASWLHALEQTHPQLTPFLRRMLASHDRAERSRELETVPKLAPPPPASSAFSIGTRVGPFALLRPLGRGGMGEVWLARQVDGRVERDVALKLPMIHQHSEVWRERFSRERDILAKLTHPNIARLFDAGVSDKESSRGQPYLAMEHVEGESLTDFVAARKSSIAERLKLFMQILAAVAHAHRHLVVHRDLKPANILIDSSGQVKLLDFGIAKLLDGGAGANAALDLTQLGGRVMTLRYAAPEQVADGDISTATDVYALGVILHELLTGLSPYRAVREQKIFTDSALLNAEPALPSALRLSSDAASERKASSPAHLAKQISGDLDAILLKAMRRNPLERYTSIDQFEDDIRRHLDSRPVKARAGTWRYLAGRFVVRNKLPIATVAGVLVTMAVGLAMVEQQRRMAVAEKARAEKHFASVRKLANSFMFDVHEEIKSLPGSLKAREMLVKTSLQYLDSLSAEAGNDAGLTAELASAYRKTANIQGEIFGASLGAMSDSLKNYEKAKDLFISLGTYKADDIAVQREFLSLRYLLARAYMQNGDPRWQENMAAAATLAAHVATLKGAGPRDRGSASLVLAEQAQLTTVMIGPSPASEAMINRAVSQLEQLSREFPDEYVVQDPLAASYLRAASVYESNRNNPQNIAKAIEFRGKTQAMYEIILAKRANDVRVKTALLFNQMGLADNLAQAHRYAEADQTIQLALKQARLQAAADPKDTYQLVTILRALGIAVRIAYRSGDSRNTIQRGRETLTHVAAMPSELQKTRDARDAFADMKLYLGLALLATADQPATTGGNRTTRLGEACALLADSVAFMEEVQAEKLGPIDDADARERTEGLARCKAQLATAASRQAS